MRRVGIFIGNRGVTMTTNNEAWAFIDESGRAFVHPFAVTAIEVWDWVMIKRLISVGSRTIEQLKAKGCRVARVRIEILEDGE
jgi:hypothetical protein